MTSLSPKEHTGLKRLWNAIFHSASGVRSCFRTEEAFQQEILLAIVLIPLGLYLGDTAVERLLLCISVMFVLLVELLNTAIERAIDRISFDRHELSKEAKDMGSAAVLLSILIAAFTWLVILL